MKEPGTLSSFCTTTTTITIYILREREQGKSIRTQEGKRKRMGSDCSRVLVLER